MNSPREWRSLCALYVIGVKVNQDSLTKAAKTLHLPWRAVPGGFNVFSLRLRTFALKKSGLKAEQKTNVTT